MDDYLKSQGGANQGNILALIARLENEKANINKYNPINALYSTEDQYTRKIDYLKKLLKNQQPENIILKKKKEENNELSKLQLNSNNMNFIPIEQLYI